jgi:DNA polymerase-3 subunit alpha
MLLAVADEAERSRNSGQAALFGDDDHPQQALRLVEAEPWSRAEQMAKERENFGFYFAAHPVEQWRAIANANGSRTFSSLMQSGVSGGSGRMQAAMAAMVEGVQRRKTKRGKDFVMAEFSDPSGQFSASCFEESLVENFQQWARDGTCVLLQVELDAPSPDEPPRVTVRGARPLSEVRESARMELRFEVDRVEAMGELSLLLPTGDAATGEVYATLLLGQNQEPVLRLGSNFMLDSEVAERVALIEGVHRVQLGARRGAAKLRLVA